MKKEQITNLWVQGLLMATVMTTAIAMVDPVWAQAANGLSTTVTNSKTSVFGPMLTVSGYLCYVLATIMGIGGVIKLNAHATNPTGTPMSHGVTRIAVAATLAAIPNLVGMLANTGSSTMSGTANFQNLSTVGGGLQ